MSQLEQVKNESIVKSFILNTGGGSLYCLSALSIILGLSQVMAPILNTDELVEKILCIGSLNLYECLLIGVLLFLLVRQQLKTVSLYVLLGIFYFSGGLLINSLASDNTNMALSIGTGAFLLMLIKSLILQRFSGFSMSRLRFSAIMVLGLWNFLMPGLCSYVFDEYGSAALPSFWRLASLSICAFQLLLILDELFRPDGNRLKKLFLAELFIVALMNQFALPYIFNFTTYFYDFLPLISLGALYIAASSNSSEIIWSACLFPLVLFVLTTSSRGFLWVDYTWSTEVYLSVFGLLTILIAWKKKTLHLPYLALTYFVTLGLNKYLEILDPSILLVAIVSGLSIVLAYHCWQRQVFAQVSFALLSLIGFLNWPGVETYCEINKISSVSLFFITLGALLFLYNLCRYEDTRLYYVAVILMVSSLLYLPSLWPLMIAAGLLSSFFMFLSWRYVGDNWLAILFSLPILRMFYHVMPTITGWHFIILSFVLLGMGTYLNCRKAVEVSD